MINQALISFGERLYFSPLSINYLDPRCPTRWIVGVKQGKVSSLEMRVMLHFSLTAAGAL